ncbi:TRAP transporter substrate-binding protein [Maridesulfovibrio hydrothermalis]|uniref:TRAP dicarboxylate transporter-DctP subunit n=1 Tax=Maridesulfovibrio hydrothermalis AM13 = DSM 14728 TaxID=1121451 RepID=L0R9S8_9BACT|nr:TRAP transporter substrate-binding protein [Maridesulfovibrio hydrothermalis]CCO23504.1 TRAP dicarboxylate transporter-DctP subunit [Maridesulfovibrio hydrothermalis AM13 = DSM 14728]
MTRTGKLTGVFAALMICAAMLCSVSPVSAADVIKLSYANFPPAKTFPCVQMERWKQEVEKRTNGKVLVQTYPGSTLLGAKTTLRGVMQGQASIGCISLAYHPGVFPLSSVFELPLGFTTATSASLALWDLYEKYQPKEFKRFKVLTMFTSAPSNLMTKAPVRKLEDLKGLELRASGILSKILESLGATPVSMPMSATPEALQKGVVKGLFSSFDVLKDLNFAEICRYETVTNTAVYPFAIIMNMKAWNDLPDDVKKVMNDLGREQAQWTGEYMDQHVKDSLAWAEEKYSIEMIKMSDADMQAIREKTVPLIEDWKKKATGAGIAASAVLSDVEASRLKYEAAK